MLQSLAMYTKIQSYWRRRNETRKKLLRRWRMDYEKPLTKRQCELFAFMLKQKED